MLWFAAVPALACSVDGQILDDVPSHGVVPPGAWIGVKPLYESGKLYVVMDDATVTELDGRHQHGWLYASLPEDLPLGPRTWGFDTSQSWFERTVEIGEVDVPDDFPLPEAIAISARAGVYAEVCDTAAEPVVYVRSSWMLPLPPAAGWTIAVVDEDGATVDLRSWQMGGTWDVEEPRVGASSTVCHGLSFYDALHRWQGSVEPVCAEVEEADPPRCGCRAAPAAPWSALLLAIGALARRRSRR